MENKNGKFTVVSSKNSKAIIEGELHFLQQ